MKKQMLWQIMLPCLVAVMMLMLMLPVYVFSYQNAREMAVEHVTSRARTGLNGISTIMSSHNANLYELSASKEVRSFLKKNANHQQQGINAYHYINGVRSTHILNDLVKDVMISFSGNEVVIGMNMVSLAPERDYGKSFYVDTLDYGAFRQLLLAPENFLPAQHYFSYYLCNEPCIVYQRRDYGSSPNVHISSFLSVEAMKQKLGFYDIEDAVLRLSTAVGDVTLYQTGLDTVKSLYDSASCILVTLQDDKLGLKVEFGIPSGYIRHQMRPILMTMFIYALAAFSVAMIVSVTHMVRSFHHASPLLAYLKGSSMETGKGNLYEQIYQALQASDQRSEIIRAHYTELVQERRTLVMEKIMHRLPLEADDWRVLDELTVFGQGWVAAQFELKKPQDAEEHMIALNVIVRSVLQNVWPGSYVHMSDANRLLCLIPKAEAGMSLMEKTVGDIERQTGAAMYVGVSLPHTDVKELPAACDEALRSAFAAHRGQVLFYTADMGRQSELSLFGMCRELSERMNMGNEERVNELFALLRQQLGKEHEWQPPHVIHAVASAVEFTLSNTADDKTIQRVQTANRPWRDVFEELNLVAVQYCWRIQKRKNQQKSEKADEIVGYISEHYAAPDICLTKIAERFQVTESYISWYIKTHTGRNYTAHIEELRMQEAMRMLKEEDTPISEIAQRVGYEHINTFYKSFRRYWNNAPGYFRKEK